MRSAINGIIILGVSNKEIKYFKRSRVKNGLSSAQYIFQNKQRTRKKKLKEKCLNIFLFQRYNLPRPKHRLQTTISSLHQNSNFPSPLSTKTSHYIPHLTFNNLQIIFLKMYVVSPEGTHKNILYQGLYLSLVHAMYQILYSNLLLLL